VFFVLFAQVIKEDGQLIAVIANEIISARHKLDTRQQKIIAWALGQTARDDSDFLTHKLSIAEFAKLTGSESGSLYSEMEAVTKSLLRSIVELKIDDGDRRRVVFQWLSRCVYRDGEGTVELRFHDELKPYLLELRTRFTQLRLERFFKFRSSYTIRFYERIEMQRGLKQQTWTVPLDELRTWLGIDEESYEKFGLFRKRVLEAAQTELDIRSDSSFSYQMVKTGRKVTGVQFTLRPARAPKVVPHRDRWKKLDDPTRAAILAEAKKMVRWEGDSDETILADDTFWARVPDLLDRVAGQRTFEP
jgi:plasmid replication initiation protein